MGTNIELWTYRLFTNGSFYLEEVLQKAAPQPGGTGDKNPVMVSAGKKAAMTRASGSYTFEQHLAGKPQSTRELAVSVHDFIAGLDPAVEVAPKKLYIAYKISQNLACMEVHKMCVVLFLKLNPKEVKGPPGISRDMSSIGLYVFSDFGNFFST